MSGLISRAIPSSRAGPVALVCANKPLFPRAQALADSLRLPLFRNFPDDTSLVLVLDEQGLSLKALGNQELGALRVDFAAPALTYRQHNHLSQELLAKALGVSGQQRPRLWDVTAGLGRDGWILAGLGCEVTLFERHPIVHALLHDGLLRGANSNDTPVASIAKRLCLFQRDGIAALEDGELSAPDIVYMDPMFPDKRKNAKAKKAMQYFQVLVGKDVDEEALFAAAIARARFRVIVKRPPSAPPLSAFKPSAQLSGKTVRYDIYALQSAKRYLENKRYLEVKNNQIR